ncbi:glycosyltransferase family 4 protein [Mucilaginibacter sp. dw_454]|uniref:glycosyltransferase family 4 protein n=1 Tax=Mucilaginibacter sp. dw_454 TaxID=2720079 RepID=UPI001BD67F3A|nr:glycosyltransferase family 4 protein [Mucilaginibacter sp. dw_454]
MRICHVICNLYAGGAQTFLVLLALEQKKLGNDVSIVLIDKRKNAAFETFLIGELEAHDIQVFTLQRKPGRNFTIIKSLTLFREYLKEFKPDIVNTHLPISHLFVGLYKKAFKFNIMKARVIATIHNAPEPWSKPTLLTNLHTPGIYCSNASIKTSIERDCLKTVIDNGIIPPVVNDSADKIIEEYKVNKDHKLVLMVGKLSEQKNYPLAVAIASLYQDKKVSFLICGILEETSERDLALFKTVNNIHFLGVKLPDQIHSLMDRCDCFLNTSLFEGLPITILEAFFIGQPCVLAPILSLTDIGEEMPYCYIADSFDPEAFVPKIDEALSLSLSREQIKKERETSLEKYQVDKAAIKYLDFYNTVIGSQ